jgi:hypothetical protein
MKLFLVSMLVMLASCTLLENIGLRELDKIKITYDKEPDANLVDSLVIHNKSAYFKIDCLDDESEYEFQQNGYSIWVFKVGNTVRVDVQRNDSLIYIYSK